jgi:ABC-type sugar transport system ATPase subunit
MKARLENVSFDYGGEPVLSDVTVELPEGGVTVVVGPSGSGKSTLLQILAGLLRPLAGRVSFDGDDVTRVPAERRDVGVVFQSYALFPHLTVRDNIAFGLSAGHRFRRRFSRSGRRPTRHQVDERVWDTAAMVGIERLLDRKPSRLSGGEQQRVALARAVAPRPSLLLLDEPLSALDARLRRSLRSELAGLLRRLGTTVFYVTHDQEEAMLLADHLVVLDRGRVVQEGPPLELYRRPANPFVASFLGEANLLEVVMNGEPQVATPLGPMAWPAGSGGGSGVLLVRPEDLAADPRGVPAEVMEARGLGPYDRVVLRFEDGSEAVAHLPADSAPPAGATLRVVPRQGRVHLFSG